MKFRGLGCVLCALVPVTVFAQDADEERASGVRAGSFIISPSVSVTTGYDSNVFLQNNNQEESFRVIIAPELSIQSDWNRHALVLNAGVEYGYPSHDSDDQFLDYGASLTGVVDITREARVLASIGYLHGHEDRGSVDVPGLSAEPVETDTFNASLGAELEFNAFRVNPQVEFGYLDFEDTPLIGGGFDNQDDRDRTELSAGLELGYEVQRGYEAFVSFNYFNTDYNDALDDTGVNRDSSGWRVLTGVNFELTRLLEGRLGVGYAARDYSDVTLGDTSGLSLDAGLTWSPTRRMEIALDASRDIQETTLVGASSTQTSSIRLGTSYELLRNLSIDGALSYSNLDYEGIVRTDNIYGIELGADWVVNRNITISPTYLYQTRESEQAGAGYFAHEFLVTATYVF